MIEKPQDTRKLCQVSIGNDLRRCPRWASGWHGKHQLGLLGHARGRRAQGKMTPVGFEPTQLALVELESTPLDHSGKVSMSFSAAYFLRQTVF